MAKARASTVKRMTESAGAPWNVSDWREQSIRKLQGEIEKADAIPHWQRSSLWETLQAARRERLARLEGERE